MPKNGHFSLTKLTVTLFLFTGRNGLVPATYVRQMGATNTGSTNFGSSSYGGQKTYDYQTTKSSEYRKSSDGRSGGSIDFIRDDIEGEYRILVDKKGLSL